MTHATLAPRLASGNVGLAATTFTIAVVAGTGEGKTTLSAFDSALHRAGVHNYNLIPLSSVIPPATRVLCADRHTAHPDAFGHRLYVVKAEMRSDEPGTVIGAGLGWLQWGDGRGCFVEHEASARGGTRAALEDSLRGQITATLRDLAATRDIPFDDCQAQMEIVSTRVEAEPACALVLAVYEAEGWRRNDDSVPGGDPSPAAIWSSTDLPYACLKDEERTLAFQRAIRQTVRPGDIVVDAGAGSGILAFFAAEAGAARVYAVEISPDLISALRLSVAMNELDERIVVVPGDATMVDLPRHVDVVIGELMETGLIEETQVAVMNSLRRRGVIGPHTRLIPEAYTTSVELVAVDDDFYGYRIAAPYHEWPNYVRGEQGWRPTRVGALTAPATVAEVDLCRPVDPGIGRVVEMTGIASGTANAVRISGVTRLAPGLVLGQTNALNGDKILRLPEPIAVRAAETLRCRVSFVMGGGLASFSLREVG